MVATLDVYFVDVSTDIELMNVAKEIARQLADNRVSSPPIYLSNDPVPT